MTDDRQEFATARDAGLRARHETRLARAQTIIGVCGQQAIVQPYEGHVRLRVADETGESFSAVMLTPDDAERLARVLIHASTKTSARPCQPGREFVAPHPSHPCGQYTRERP